MRFIIARQIGVLFAACLLVTDAGATSSVSPYLSLDAGHSGGGQRLSVAASAGLRWPNGFGVALDLTPLDEHRISYWRFHGAGPSQRIDYGETSSTYFAAAARIDWRFAVAERWSLLPTLGWHNGRARGYLPDEGPEGSYEPYIHHHGIVLGLGIERTLSPHWSAHVSAKLYPSATMNSMFFARSEKDLHRLALGVTYSF